MTNLKTVFTIKINEQLQKIEYDMHYYITRELFSHKKRVLDLKEEKTRSALIALGWTPPQK